jgi:LPXTG-motif cell wall-anchored protein
MTRRIGLTVVAALLALFTFAGPAAAQQQQYPIETGTLQADKTQVNPGDAVTITGTGCPAGSTVAITFDDQNVGSTQTRADGTFSATVTVPANATAGSHTIAATCVLANGATRRQTVTVTVLGAATRAGALPRTGTDLVPVLSVGALALIGIGGVAILAARRKRTAG